MPQSRKVKGMKMTWKEIALGFTLAALISGYAYWSHKNHEMTEAKLRSHSKTIDYTVKKGDTFWEISNKYAPKLVNELGPNIVSDYIMGDLNKRTSANLTINETIKVPVYEK